MHKNREEWNGMHKNRGMEWNGKEQRGMEKWIRIDR